jgi:hypothetical protein
VQRRRFFSFLVCAGIGRGAVLAAATTVGGRASCEDHAAWVARVLEHMKTIKPGMTRGDMAKVFTLGGGMSMRLQCRYTSRECSYFHVDVTLREARRSRINAPAESENPGDVILTISQPYLTYEVME